MNKFHKNNEAVNRKACVLLVIDKFFYNNKLLELLTENNTSKHIVHLILKFNEHNRNILKLELYAWL